MKYSGLGNYYVNYQNVMLLSPSDTKRTDAYIFVPTRENWFQYVCRVNATAINFPCIITLQRVKYIPRKMTEQDENFSHCILLKTKKEDNILEIPEL